MLFPDRVIEYRKPDNASYWLLRIYNQRYSEDLSSAFHCKAKVTFGTLKILSY